MDKVTFGNGMCAGWLKDWLNKQDMMVCITFH